MKTQRSLQRAGEAYMPATKVNGFKEEFPWAWEHIKDEKTYRVYVQGIEPEIVDYYPAAESHTSKGGEEWFRYERILFFDGNKNLITAETEYVTYCRKIPWLGKKIEKRIPVTIRAAAPEHPLSFTLEKLGREVERIRYMLSHFEDTATVILYKTPKDLSLTQWIEIQTEKEKNNFRIECLEIDGQAE